MGLIKATVGAVGSTLHDQWKEALRCDEMGNDILMKKVTTKNGVISNGSAIIVGPGQCAIIFDNGRVIDATAEEGYYKFDTSSTPSLFEGEFKGMFKEMWQRFTFNGASAKQQAVFFFNIKEIINNKFGTPAPVMYDDWSHAIPNQMTGETIPLSVFIKCFGTYTFKIINPATFMNEIAGMSDEYRKDELLEQMRSEVMDSFEKVLNQLGCVNKIPVRSLPSQKDKVKEIMAEGNYDEAIQKRGISIIGFNIESVSLDDESQEKINNYELSSNAYIQQGTMVGAYAQSMKDAANNPNGATNGFVGVGMANMASGGMMGGATTSPWQNATPVQNNSTNNTTSTETWECPNCKKQVNGNFCPDCGAKKPEKAFCPNCGKKVDKDTKFCPDCGTKLN
jgi:membrane protease subunit (stomatin/prohibitin family)